MGGVAVLLLVFARPGLAQVTTAAGYTPPDDTPAIRIGATIFPEYVFTNQPDATDADGNVINASAFNVTRAYINVTGNISHLVAFRITPDITRETFAGPVVSGSLVFRVKYAYAQINLDDWMTHGSWARFGIQQTPIVDFEESIYRYRFQGTVFSERDGFLTSSDAGVSFHYNIPQNYGDVHVGYYNGDGYTRADPNDQKAFQIRGTVRPLPMSPLLRGVRVTGFYDADHYLKDGDRTRGMLMITFEHKYVNAGWDYLQASDQTSIQRSEAKAEGFSVWATPKTAMGIEGLLRYDHVKPNRSVNAERSRAIVGIAYWFPHQGNVSTAFLLDYEQTKSDRFSPAVAKIERIGVHGLVNF